MRLNQLLLLVLAVATLASTGCTHHQLRRSMVGQSGMVADMYQQQVLDNLAKFVRDPNALPYFAVPGKGFTEVTDSATAGGGLEWNFTRFSMAGLSGGGERQVQENYELLPVSDPRKLELMRCAFRKAVAGYHPTEDTCCPHCEQRFRHFYTGKTNEGVSKKTAEGIVTSDCLSSCWFRVGCSDCKKKLMRENPCCLVGEHCGTVVWTCPGVGTEELAKLTIAILDYATNEPPVVSTKTRTVIAYRDGFGNPTSPSKAAYAIQGEVAIDKEIDEILYGIPVPEIRTKQIDPNALRGTPLDGGMRLFSTEDGKFSIETPMAAPVPKPTDTQQEVVPARRSLEMLPTIGLPRFEFERLNN